MRSWNELARQLGRNRDRAQCTDTSEVKTDHPNPNDIECVKILQKLQEDTRMETSTL